MWEYIKTGIVGVVGGILGGMGMGGGTILIPMLTIFCSVSQHGAQGANLIAFIPMAVCSLAIHIKNKLVRFDGLWIIILSSLLTGVGGSLLSTVISGKILKRIFGGFLVILSVLNFFGDKLFQNKEKDGENSDKKESKKSQGNGE